MVIAVSFHAYGIRRLNQLSCPFFVIPRGHCILLFNPPALDPGEIPSGERSCHGFGKQSIKFGVIHHTRLHQIHATSVLYHAPMYSIGTKRTHLLERISRKLCPFMLYEIRSTSRSPSAGAILFSDDLPTQSKARLTNVHPTRANSQV